jgi:hypothetical protein
MVIYYEYHEVRCYLCASEQFICRGLNITDVGEILPPSYRIISLFLNFVAEIGDTRNAKTGYANGGYACAYFSCLFFCCNLLIIVSLYQSLYN